MEIHTPQTLKQRQPVLKKQDPNYKPIYKTYPQTMCIIETETPYRPSHNPEQTLIDYPYI